MEWVFIILKRLACFRRTFSLSEKLIVDHFFQTLYMTTMHIHIEYGRMSIIYAYGHICYENSSFLMLLIKIINCHLSKQFVLCFFKSSVLNIIIQRRITRIRVTIKRKSSV